MASHPEARAQSWQWANNPGYGEGSSVAVDAAGNVYVTGTFSGTTTFGSFSLTSAGGYDVYVARLSSAGVYQWAVRAGGTGHDQGLDVDTDGSGNVYLTGSYAGSAAFGTTTLTGGGLFAAKLSSSGAWQWATRAASATGYDLVVDGSGLNVYVAGSFTGTTAFGPSSLTSAGADDAFVARLSSAGSWQWAVRGGGSGIDQSSRVAVDASGNVYLTGAFNTSSATFGSTTLASAGAADVFVARLSSTGAWQWVVRGGGVTADFSNGLGVDASGNVLLGGTFGDFSGAAATYGTTTLTSAGERDIFAAKLNGSTGAWLWALSAGGTHSDGSTDLAVDASGNAYLTGYSHSSSLAFGPSHGCFGGDPDFTDIFVARVNANGTWEWATHAGDLDSDMGTGLATASNRVYLTGFFGANFQHSYLFDGSALILGGGIFVSSLVQGPPTITGFNPSQGPVGTPVNITGINYVDVTGVFFNGTPAPGFSVTTYSSVGTIHATVPAGAATGPITVTTAHGSVTSAASFTIAVPAPTTTGAARCGSGAVTLQASGAPAGGSYRWYTVATGGSAISGATGPSYTTPTLYATTTYYVSALDAGGNESPRTAVTATIRYTQPPSIVASGPTSFNAGGSVTLTARPNLALRFNGSNQYVTTNLNAQSSALPTTTWEAWIYPTRVNHFERQSVLSVDDGDYDRTVLIEAGTDSWAVFVGGDVWYPATVEVNAWQHIAVVYSPTGVRFYKNGVEYVYSGAFNPDATTLRFSIGYNPGFGEYFQGQIDEVRVWSTARTQSQLLTTMYAPPAGTTAGLAGAWRFNESSGAIATDDRGVNNGTLMNIPTHVTPGQTAILASSYAWSPAAGLSATTTASVTASPSTTTTYTVAVTDHNGCSPTAQQTITITGPVPTISSFTPTSGLLGTSVTITGTNFTGATAVRFNGTSAAFTVSSATSISTSVPSGATTGRISVTTPGGTATSAGTFTVQAPVVSSFSPSSALVGATVTVTGNYFSGATAVQLNGVAVSSFSVSSATSLTFVVPADAATGKISVTTPTGTGTSAASFRVLPTISSFSPTGGQPGTVVTITGTGLTGATAVRFNGVTASSFTVSSGTSVMAVVPSTATTGKVSVITPGGTATSTGTFTVSPIITGFIPSQGAPGSVVLVQGLNFISGTTSRFNGTSATTTYNASTQLTAIVPAGATSGNISATNANGTGTSSSSYTVVSGALPTISSFSPTTNVVAGSSITITGTNFTGATLVRFNNVNATSFTVHSPTSITATVPAGALTGKIYVATPSGMCQSAANLTITQPPSISSLSPTSGAVGSVVLLTGYNLTGASSVTLNGTAVPFSVNSSTSITASVPSGASTGKFAVTTIAGSALSVATFTVSAGPAPSITSLSPTSGIRGSAVTITGSNFSGVTSVKLGSLTASYTVNSPTQLTLTVPATATSNRIYVTTSGGGMAQSSTYTVILPPTISSFSPASGAVGSTVTINGTNLTGASSVTFGGVAATSYSVVSSVKITATVPAGAATGNIAVTTVAGTATRGTFTVTGPRPLATAEADLRQPLSLYPNPAHEQVYLTGQPGTRVELLDALGRPLQTLTLQEGETWLDLRHRPAGLYLLRSAGQTHRLIVE